MKQKFTLRRASAIILAMPFLLLATEGQAQQLKVDISITNRQAQEVQEPGYALWQAAQGKSTSMEFFVEGDSQSPITCTLSCPAEADYEVRTGWSKTYIQNATYKEQNGRLTFDGISLDPRTYGSFTLKLEGLPAGQHTIQTYHNCWENPTAFYAVPMTVKLNGEVVHENVLPTFLQAVAANARLLVTPFTIKNDGDAVELEFITSEENPGAPDNNQANAFTAPLLNGFELNTADITVQAKEPYPANNDMHADCDDGSVTLSWVPASASVKEHRLYFGKSEDNLTQLATIVGNASQRCEYAIDNLYSGDTYYWRVDEVTYTTPQLLNSPTPEETVSEGAVWCFKPRQLAFPEAEGYGRFAIGGRGGSVYHVTSLSSDNVPGTLKYGLLLDEPHTIVFDVSGIIDLGFEAIFTKPYITIAAQTAPGKGICLKASNINIGSDNIARFVRFKRGLGVYGENTGNAMGMSGADNSIVDHCTAAWGTDETVSGRGAKNISFQYSMISEALGITGHKNYSDGTNHGFAATIDGQKGSWHHNLLVNCNGRNWSMGGGMDGQNRPIGGLDLFNNVCYNWWGRTTDGNCHEVNFVNNYYKMGPDTKRTELFIMQFELATDVADNRTNTAYINGNIRENKNHTLTNDKKGTTYTATGYVPTDYAYMVNEPLFPSYATIHSAKDAMKIVTSYGGAIMPMRDEHHVRNIRETLDGTWTYKGSKSGIRGEIDTEEDITEHADGKGWEEWPEETRDADWDTDQDGMPDWWERCVGSDPLTANNNDDPDKDGYTLLEDYLEFMAHPYIAIKPNGSGTIDLKEHFAGFFGQNGKSETPTFSVDNILGGIYTPSIDGTSLIVSTVKPDTESIGMFNVTCSDGETTFTQRFGVAIFSKAETTAIMGNASKRSSEIIGREFFTLDGKHVSKMRPMEVYLMKETYADGTSNTTKIIKN